MSEKRTLVILLCFVGITVLLIKVYAEDYYSIPIWLKQSALWWSEGKISDSEFVDSIQYLIEQKIVKVGNPSETNIDSIILPLVTTDKRTYHTGEEIKISGSGFQNGTIGILVGDDRFELFLDKSRISLAILC